LIFIHVQTRTTNITTTNISNKNVNVGYERISSILLMLDIFKFVTKIGSLWLSLGRLVDLPEVNPGNVLDSLNASPRQFFVTRRIGIHGIHGLGTVCVSSKLFKEPGSKALIDDRGLYGIILTDIFGSNPIRKSHAPTSIMKRHRVLNYSIIFK